MQTMMNREVDFSFNHEEKLASIEALIAVVGTMKSGKSSCINALIGQEVLPNRSMPMTSVPTIIKHKYGVKKPILYFENIEPILLMMVDLQTAIISDYDKYLECIAEEPDLKSLLKNIQCGTDLGKIHIGSENIFEFLKTVNDLIRVGKKFKINFPFHSFKRREDFPLIEVEFDSLCKTFCKQESIALLDTAGFNEAGHENEFRAVLNEVLKKVDAVISVVDYRQQNSTAEQELFDLVKNSDIKPGNTFVILNKVDTVVNDRETVKAGIERIYVMFSNRAKKENIQPFSSRNALLAHKVLSKISFTSSFYNDFSTDSWEEEFLKLMVGRRYSRRIVDEKNILIAVNELKDSAYFDSIYDSFARFCKEVSL